MAAQGLMALLGLGGFRLTRKQDTSDTNPSAKRQGVLVQPASNLRQLYTATRNQMRRKSRAEKLLAVVLYRAQISRNCDVIET